VSGSSAPPGPDARLLRRVRLQLVAWSGIAVLLVLLALGLALYLAISSSLAQTGETQLRERASALAQTLAQSRGSPERGRFGFVFGGQGSGTFALAVGPRDEVIGVPDFVPTAEIPDRAGLAAARGGSIDVRTASLTDRDEVTGATRAVPIRVMSVPANRRGQTYVVQVIQDRTPEVNTLGVFLTVLGLGGLLALTASLLAGAGYATRALVPIRDALRRQREFAADASHELRTPLTIVRGNVELVRRRVADDATSAALLDDVDAEVTHLAALVDDLLLLARTDSGAAQLTATSLDLADVALDAMSSLSGLAEGRGVSLELASAPAPVMGDPIRLRQLVTVLVDNGVRHTPRGGRVTIRVHPDGNRSALEVIDDGPGVRPEDAPHIFDRFWRSPTAPAGGTGLGLAIASWIVEQHSGSIAVDRADGRGARFVARLPLDRGSAAPSPQGSVAREPR
jgi:signal transduction histidine kinase